MSDIKSFVTSVFESDKKEYSKETADSGGANSQDTKEFAGKVIDQLNNVQSGKFFSNAAANIGKMTSDFLDKLNESGFGGLKTKLTEMGENTNNPLKKAGFSGALAIVSAASKIVDGLAEKVKDTVFTKLHIPDPVYLASLIAFDAAGANLEYNGNYIRRLIIRRDLTICLEWLNKIYSIKYSGLRSDNFTYDAIMAARGGAYKNVKLILDQFRNNSKELTVIMQNTTDENLVNVLRNTIAEIDEMIVYTMKNLIVYSYSNFTADDLREMLNRYEVNPSIFGTTDTEYGGKYTIRSRDINIMAPLYVVGNINPDKYQYSSRYRRKNYKEKIQNVIDNKLTYIRPRNKNVKRLYLILTSNRYTTNTMYNRELAIRLQYKIISSIGETLNEMLGYSVGTIGNMRAAYDYTREIEHLLFDPARIEDFRISDKEVIKVPEEIKEKVIDQKDESNDSQEDHYDTLFTDIGSTILIDSIKRDLAIYKDSDSPEPVYYDDSGNRVMRTSSGYRMIYENNEVYRWLNERGEYIYFPSSDILFIIVNNRNEVVLDNNGDYIVVGQEQVIDIPINYKDIVDALPENFDDYVESIVDNYLSANISDLTKIILGRIATGDLHLSTDDAIERLIYKYYLENGGVPYAQINMDLVIPVILDRLRDGIYGIDYILSHTVTDMINSVVDEMRTDGTYIEAFNSQSEINILRLILEDVNSIMIDILRGNMHHYETPDYQTLYNRAVINNSKGISSSFGELSDDLYLVTRKLNDRLTHLSKAGVTEVTNIDQLTEGKTYEDMVKEASEITSNPNNKIDRSEDPSRLIIVERIREIIREVRSGKISVHEIPEFVELNREAKSEIEDKTDLTEITERLKDYGVDMKDYDIIEYHKRKDDKINNITDIELFDFDVENPPIKVYRSIDDEYNERMNSKSIYYKWINT